MWPLAALLLTAGVAWPTLAAAGDGAPEFVYDVTRRAALRDIPGTAITFPARAGRAARLVAADLSTRPVTALAAGDNVGNTFAVSCAGPKLDRSAEQGAYWATNLVPPGEKGVEPDLRWLFVAPADGEFTCRLRISSYSTIITGDRRVTMRIPAGARLTRLAAPEASRWTLPAADATRVAGGESARVLRAVYPLPDGDAAVRVGQDAALSTCKANSSIPGCAGGSADVDGSVVDTSIEVRPRAADGADCGADLAPPEHRISTAKHHLSATNTVDLPRERLRGCTSVEVALLVKHLSGNPVLIHAGTSAGNAATRGFATLLPTD
ncbi:hypothetical protein [Pilimelia anulata]|uniref:hypothetical protein n=1 Tax=Pilimelia anulata TaxID=53371 RepID=UPI00166410EC|nr:hypothetical protein [Pilimelia anulata]